MMIPIKLAIILHLGSEYQIRHGNNIPPHEINECDLVRPSAGLQAASTMQLSLLCFAFLFMSERQSPPPQRQLAAGKR